MTEQRYDIVVQDKVSKSIRQNLLGIASAARDARTELNSFKAQMGAMTGSMASLRGGAQTLRNQAAETRNATAAIRDQTSAIQAQAQAMRDLANASRSSRGAGAAGAVGAAAGAGAAGARAASVSGIAQASRNAAGLNKIGEQARLTSHHLANLSFQLNDVFVSLASGQKPLTVFVQQGAQIAQIPVQAGLSFKQFGVAALNTLGIIKRTGDAAADAAAQIALVEAASLSSASQMASGNVRIAETEVALATAQQRQATTASELTVATTRLTAAQQALAVAQVEAKIATDALSVAQDKASAAGARASAMSRLAIGPVGAVALTVAAVLATLGAGLALIGREAQKTAGLKTYTKEMGYTAAEVKKLNAVSVTFGDTIKAVFQVALRNIASSLGIDTKKISSLWNSFLDGLWYYTKIAVSGIYASFAGLSNGVRNIVKNLGDGVANDNPFVNIINGYTEAFNDSMQYFDDVVEQAGANARKRQEQMAAEFLNERKGAKGARGFDRAKEWRDANAELDVQISLLGKYGLELERAQRIEQIGRTFREHGVALTTEEVAILDAKIRRIQEGTRVQQAMTAAEEAANGPLRDLNAKEEALNNLLDDQVITMEEYNRQWRLARLAYEEATDPLKRLNDELRDNAELIGTYGKARSVAEYRQQLINAAEQAGLNPFETGQSQTDPNGDIVVTGSRNLNPELQRMLDEFKRQQQQAEYEEAFQAIDPRENEDPSNSAYILQNYRELYEHLAELREKNILDEQEADQRLLNLKKAYLDAQLSYTSDVLSNMAILQESSVKEVAALGKAAAIANATINAYLAVSQTLADPTLPTLVKIPLAVSQGVIAAAQIAKIAGVGFRSGGYTGDGPTNAVAGAVHGQEYVFDAEATRRIGVPALEAARRTGSLQQPSSSGSQMVSVNILPQPGVFVEERRTSAGEIELIAKRVVSREAATAVARDIRGNPNSAASKAIGGAYGLRRADR